MKLTTVEVVTSAMGVDSGDDTQNAIDDAIESATDSLAAWSRHSFELTSRQDDFTVDFRTLLSGDDTIMLGLTQGFVNVSPAVSVIAARVMTDFAAGNIVDVSSVVDLDKEKGVISFPNTIELGQTEFNTPRYGRIMGARWFFRVTYTSGFTADVTDPDLYDGVPSWLARAANLQARISLNAHPAYVENKSTTDAKMLGDQLAMIINQKARYIPNARQATNQRTF